VVELVILRDGILFAGLDVRLQRRYRRLVREHCHVLNAAASGISALPGVAESFACTQAMWRFLANPRVDPPTLMEPVLEAVRGMLRDDGPSGDRPAVLVVHDWSSLHYGGSAKADRRRRTHAADVGYELACALAVDADTGDPLGPLELRLRTADGVPSTRRGGAEAFDSHPDEVLPAMRAVAAAGLGREAVHVIDREADSVGHYREWDAAGFRFLVRADDARAVRWGGRERRLPDVADALFGPGAEVVELVEPVDCKGAPARLQVAEADVVLHRPARRTAAGRKVERAGRPLGLRLVVARLVDAAGGPLARWLLLSNAPRRRDAATLARWYYHRWRVESFFKLLKSAGQNVEAWGQASGEAVLRRLAIASMACSTAWRLHRDVRPEAAEVRRVLVRLSGRQMKHRAESTAPALLAGLEKLLAILDLLAAHDLDDLRRLARSTLPDLFNSS
jgi:IS4 transposase